MLPRLKMKNNLSIFVSCEAQFEKPDFFFLNSHWTTWSYRRLRDKYRNYLKSVLGYWSELKLGISLHISLSFKTQNLYKLKIFEIPRSLLYRGQLHPETPTNFLRETQLKSTLPWKTPPPPFSPTFVSMATMWLRLEGRGHCLLFIAVIPVQQHLRINPLHEDNVVMDISGQ